MFKPNYRPISNLNFLSKVLEKIVAKRLCSYMSKNGLNEVYQSAYKSGHSVETALLKVQNDLLLDIDNKHGIILVLLDLSAAFDTLDHETLLNRLSERYGITENAHKWFKSYLCGRTSSVCINGIRSAPSGQKFGVPQGSVLGPLLFTMDTAPLSDIIASFGSLFHFYADDTQIYLSFNVKCKQFFFRPTSSG